MSTEQKILAEDSASWLVQCSSPGCTQGIRVAKRLGLPDPKDLNKVAWQQFDTPEATQAAGFGASICIRH